MKEFIEYILTGIVTQPDQIIVTETKEDTIVNISIKVAEEDLGLVIGKHGKTIIGIRNIAKAKAIKEKVKVNIYLEDQNNKQETTEENSEN